MNIVDSIRNSTTNNLKLKNNQHQVSFQKIPQRRQFRRCKDISSKILKFIYLTL